MRKATESARRLPAGAAPRGLRGGRAVLRRRRRCYDAAALRAYLRLLRFVAPYRGRFAGALACMIVLAVTTAAYVHLIGPVLEFLFTGGQATARSGRFDTLMPAWADVSGWLSGMERRRALAMLPAVITAVAVVKGVAFFGQYYLMNMLGQRVISDLRTTLFDHVLTLSPGFFAKRHSGDLMSRFSADVQAVETSVSHAITSYIRDGLTVVVMLVNCFLLDWKLSLMTFVAVPATLFPVVRLAKRLKRVTVDAQSSLGRISEIVQEAIGGIRVVVQHFGDGVGKVADHARCGPLAVFSCAREGPILAMEAAPPLA